MATRHDAHPGNERGRSRAFSLLICLGPTASPRRRHGVATASQTSAAPTAATEIQIRLNSIILIAYSGRAPAEYAAVWRPIDVTMATAILPGYSPLLPDWPSHPLPIRFQSAFNPLFVLAARNRIQKYERREMIFIYIH